MKILNFLPLLVWSIAIPFWILARERLKIKQEIKLLRPEEWRGVWWLTTSRGPEAFYGYGLFAWLVLGMYCAR
jgi:hypothetical protein